MSGNRKRQRPIPSDRPPIPIEEAGVFASERMLGDWCRIFLADPDDPPSLGAMKIPPGLEPSPLFVRALMRWFVAYVPYDTKLTQREIAAEVDIYAVLAARNVTEAREKVAERERLTIANVTQAHLRNGTATEILNAKRAAFWAAQRRPAEELEQDRRAKR